MASSTLSKEKREVDAINNRNDDVYDGVAETVVDEKSETIARRV